MMTSSRQFMQKSTSDLFDDLEQRHRKGMKVMSQLNGHVRQLRSVQAILNRNKEKTKKELDLYMQQLSASLLDFKSDMLVSLEEIMKEKQKKLTETREGLEQDIETIHSLCEETTKLLMAEKHHYTHMDRQTTVQLLEAFRLIPDQCDDLDSQHLTTIKFSPAVDVRDINPSIFGFLDSDEASKNTMPQLKLSMSESRCKPCVPVMDTSCSSQSTQTQTIYRDEETQTEPGQTFLPPAHQLQQSVTATSYFAPIQPPPGFRPLIRSALSPLPLLHDSYPISFAAPLKFQSVPAQDAVSYHTVPGSQMYPGNLVNQTPILSVPNSQSMSSTSVLKQGPETHKEGLQVTSRGGTKKASTDSCGLTDNAQAFRSEALKEIPLPSGLAPLAAHAPQIEQIQKSCSKKVQSSANHVVTDSNETLDRGKKALNSLNTERVPVSEIPLPIGPACLSSYERQRQTGQKGESWSDMNITSTSLDQVRSEDHALNLASKSISETGDGTSRHSGKDVGQEVEAAAENVHGKSTFDSRCGPSHTNVSAEINTVKDTNVTEKWNSEINLGKDKKLVVSQKGDGVSRPVSKKAEDLLARTKRLIMDSPVPMASRSDEALDRVTPEKDCQTTIVNSLRPEESPRSRDDIQECADLNAPPMKPLRRPLRLPALCIQKRSRSPLKPAASSILNEESNARGSLSDHQEQADATESGMPKNIQIGVSGTADVNNNNEPIVSTMCCSDVTVKIEPSEDEAEPQLDIHTDLYTSICDESFMDTSSHDRPLDGDILRSIIDQNERFVKQEMVHDSPIDEKGMSVHWEVEDIKIKTEPAESSPVTDSAEVQREENSSTEQNVNLVSNDSDKSGNSADQITSSEDRSTISNEARSAETQCEDRSPIDTGIQQEILSPEIVSPERTAQSTQSGLLNFSALQTHHMDRKSTHLKASLLYEVEDTLRFPIGVTVNSENQVIVTDTGNNVVKLYSDTGKLFRVLDSKVKPGLWRPSAVVVNEHDEIFVKDDICIRMFSHKGNYVMNIGQSLFSKHYGLVLIHTGCLLVLETDLRAPALVYLSQDGSQVWKYPYMPLINGTSLQQSKCRFLAVTGNKIIVSDLGLCQVYITRMEGTFLMKLGNFGKGLYEFNQPAGISVDNYGNFVIGDSRNSRIKAFRSDGTQMSLIDFETPISRPSGVHLTQDNKLIVVNYTTHKVKVYQIKLQPTR